MLLQSGFKRSQAIHSRAQYLIRRLKLSPHPEGGHYREIFRAERRVSPAHLDSERSALTTIYFLLNKDERSRWHRIGADEIWHHCEGDPLEIFWIERDRWEYQNRLLGALEADTSPVEVVPAGYWMAARTMGDYSLVGCSSGPGFEFADFQLAAELPDESAAIRQHFPGLAEFL